MQVFGLLAFICEAFHVFAFRLLLGLISNKDSAICASNKLLIFHPEISI